jgi:cytochrome P450
MAPGTSAPGTAPSTSAPGTAPSTSALGTAPSTSALGTAPNTRHEAPGTRKALPPGPKLSLFQRAAYWPGRDMLAFIMSLARTYGDLVTYRIGGETIFLVSDPADIKDILVTQNRNFTKSRGLERTKKLLGNGLLTSEGAEHLRQRRLMQPAFHRERIAGYGETMVTYADRARSSWKEGESRDIAQEMMRLTLSIAGKTLFDVDIEKQAEEVGDAMNDVMASFWTTMLPFSEFLERTIPKLRRAKAARARLDRIIYGMIAERRASGRDHGDLLSMLLNAQDEETGGSRMTDTQVRDEAMTILLAGHETTANALTWTWYLLSQAPDVETKLHAEVDRVLQGRLPGVSDLAALPFVEKVVTEAMRLYPPAWIIGRRAIAEFPIDGYVAPPRTIMIMSPYIVHHDPRYFPEPDRFHPDRWTPEFKAALPQFAYFPFGGGPRRCIGESFAWMELILVVATIAERWKLSLVPGHPVEPQPVVTLRTKHGMRMTLEKRDAK